MGNADQRVDFCALFEAVPGLYLVLAPDLTIVAVSNAYLHATMTKREEILGRGLFEVFPDNPADPAADGTRNLRASLDRVRETLAMDAMAIQKYDIRRPEAEGGGFEERFWSPMNSPVLNDAGELTYIIHRVEDVTARIRAEEAIRESNQFLEAVIENIPNMVFVKDAERLAFVRFNRAGEELLGVSRTAILGKTDHDFFPTDEAEFFQAKDRETLDGQGLVEIPEEPIQTTRGPRLLRTKKVPIRDATGTARYLLGISEDITEHKAGEEMRARLAAIVECSDDAIMSKTLDGVITSWNRGAEATFGYRSGEIIGQPMSRIFPPDRLEEEAQLLEQLRRGERVDHFETVRRRRDGRDIDFSVSVYPLKDASERIIGVSTILRDITAAKRAATERANLETRAATVLDTVLDGILVIDDGGVVSTFNRGAEAIFGYAAVEVLGKNIRMLMPEPDRSRHDGYLRQYKETGHAKIIGVGREVVGARKDGSRVPLELSVTEMWLEGKRCYTGLLRDISQRKAAEAALAKKNEELEVTARRDRIGAHVMIALNEHHDTKTPAAEVLRVLADDAGYRPLAFYEYDEWRGGLFLRAGLSLAPGYAEKTIRVGEGVVGDAAARRQPVFVDAPASAPFSLDTGVGVLPAATVFALPLLHLEKLLGVVVGASQTPLVDGDRAWLAQVASTVAIGTYAAQQFQELKALSVQLNERSRKIEAQNRELDHASRLKSEFLASMSHELRTPLNAIIGFSEVLKDGILGTLPPEQLDYVSEVYSSGRHLLSLINDILDLSKIEAGKMELDIAPVQIAELIGNALTIIKERAFKGGVTLTPAIDPGITSIDADGRKLRQIIYNLLSNAVKFTPQGGAVRVDVTRHGSTVELAVVDSGIGIAPQELPRLFQPFEQLEGGSARRFEGTGLGLVMVKNLVELHHGTLGVESELGKGSRFWVRLPATQPGAHASARSASFVDPQARISGNDTLLVLVVDDDPAAITLARRWLEKEGYDVDGAQTCDAAWAAIQKRRPDVILLDILFENGPSGWEFLERIRSTPGFADIPVVVVSIVADLGRGLALGALEVLQKPVAGTDLVRTVESLGLLPPKAGASPHVLVVDDDPRAVEHVARRLEQAGMIITRAYGGRDALAAVAAGTFSAIVLDLMMPEVTGFDVVRELRAQAATAELPIVVLTAKVLEPAERATLEQAVHLVLSKEEWDEGKFLQVIRGAIRTAMRRSAGRAAQPGHLPVEPREPAPSLAGPSRVLVIDDDPATRDLLRLYFEDAGFSVTLAVSAEDAFAKLGGMRPDLITLDLALPGMDGYAFLASHGESEQLRGIPVLVISGTDNPRQALGVGAQAVLTKPVRRHELLEITGQILGDGTDRRAYVLVVDDDPKAIQILLVEDNAANRKLIGDHLRRVGHDVRAVATADEGIALALAEPFALVVMDIQLPGTDGLTATRLLRANPATRALPILAVTAHAMRGDEERIRDAGCDAYVAKPIAYKEFLAEVARLLAGEQNRKPEVKA
jgi:PAS domain S-box-containing protein